jgi:hypothetical protein
VSRFGLPIRHAAELFMDKRAKKHREQSQQAVDRELQDRLLLREE